VDIDQTISVTKTIEEQGLKKNYKKNYKKKIKGIYNTRIQKAVRVEYGDS